jgi:uncharacterized DUF497 family protein
MKFEYDPNKSAINMQKHGVSFEEAKLLWTVPHIEIAAKTVDEPRFMIIGKLKNNFYSCVYTTRGANIIRLISARRSRKSEEVIYHDYI